MALFFQIPVLFNKCLVAPKGGPKCLWNNSQLAVLFCLNTHRTGKKPKLGKYIARISHKRDRTEMVWLVLSTVIKSNSWSQECATAGDRITWFTRTSRLAFFYYSYAPFWKNTIVQTNKNDKTLLFFETFGNNNKVQSQIHTKIQIPF